MYDTTVDGWVQWRATNTRWCTKQLLMDEKDEESIPDDVRNNCWWMRPMKDYPHLKVYETTVDGWERWSSTYQMMYETTDDEWEQSRTAHTRWCTKQLLMDETDEGILPDNVWNNCGWMRPMKNYPFQMVNKATGDGRETSNIHTRWCTKQLLMDEKDDGIHTRWCTKQLSMDENNEELPIRDGAQSTKLMNEREEIIPDDVRNNCWWMRPMKDCTYQMMYKTALDGWKRWINPYQMMYKTIVDEWDK